EGTPQGIQDRGGAPAVPGRVQAAEALKRLGRFRTGRWGEPGSSAATAAHERTCGAGTAIGTPRRRFVQILPGYAGRRTDLSGHAFWGHGIIAGRERKPERNLR